jgi:hypothetical protein
MLDDLDATLRALLADPAAPADLRAADVSFDTPDGNFRPAQPTVNFFLLEVTENRELRDEARIVARARAGAGYTSRLPSMRVDCTYLVTAWSSHSGGFKPQEEHRLMGHALTWLSRFLVIDESHLQGGLKTPPQPYPVSLVVARTKENQGMGHFWSALGIAPRPAFPLTVTIAVEPFDEVERIPEVRAIRLEQTEIDHPLLSGRVLDDELAPVPNATVALVGTDGGTVATRTSDDRGTFAFPDVEFGAYRLMARAPGHTEWERSVLYTRTSQVHDLVLPRP